MKKFYLLFITVIFLSVLTNSSVFAQCPGGYSSAQVNWDNLDYYWNSGSSSATPYANYISDAREMTQKFGFGTTSVTIATSNAALMNPGSGNSGENATHTGDLAGYTGEDVQYTPNALGQTITMTFATPVSGPNFTLYDIDALQSMTITATNNLGVPTTVNVGTYAGTILTIGGTALARTITASATSLANNLNTGSATITVPGLVNSITITIVTVGSDANFWLSDINGCVSGSFPVNWHQVPFNRPLVGPTQTMPDYFIVTPDNNSAYYVDPATGDARLLMTDASKTYINSFAYDPEHQYLYYISENATVNAGNKTVKRYDYITGTSTTIIADITAAPLNIPTFNSGVESAGCAFYNGSLYFGIEGGTQGSGGSLRTRESIIWKIDFDGSGNPVDAVQVFATNAGTNSATTSVHDWGDFIIRDGIIYDFNTARNSCGGSCMSYAQSKFHHYNMMTGNMDALYTNPGTALYSGQAAMGWNGNLYYFRPAATGTTSVVGLYNEDGTVGAPVTINVASGPAWPGGSGDASDPFRPKCDFGDAPASYDPYVDPATQSPAVHERTDSIRLGTSWDMEYWKKGISGSDDTDDGLGTVPILAPGGGGYVCQVSAYNHSGADATLIAWLDYNGNGTFDASEAITPVTVPSSASQQNVWLYWAATPNTFVNGQHTYLRIRITSAAAGMNSNHATGYFTNGEVEDYQVLIDNFPLATRLISFDAALNNREVQLNWRATEETGLYAYLIEKSTDNNNWVVTDTVIANGKNGTFAYSATDKNVKPGQTFYRLRLVENTGMNRFSEIKKVSVSLSAAEVRLAPNPVKDRFIVSFYSALNTETNVSLLSSQGTVLRTLHSVSAVGINNIEMMLPEGTPNGTYIVRIESGGMFVNKKIVINK